MKSEVGLLALVLWTATVAVEDNKKTKLPRGVKQTKSGSYAVQMWMKQKQTNIHLGVFPTPTEARKRYQDALKAKISGSGTKIHLIHKRGSRKGNDLE